LAARQEIDWPEWRRETSENLVTRWEAFWRSDTVPRILRQISQSAAARTVLDLTLRSPHGGLFGSLDWAAMMILGTALADLFHAEGRLKKAFPWASLVVLAVGIGLAFLLPVSKHRVSASYVLISLGISALLFLAFHWLVERFNWQGRFLVVWGRNPLVLYFLHYLLIGIVFIPGIPEIYEQAPLWLALIEMVVLVGGISAVAYWMDRKGIVISL